MNVRIFCVRAMKCMCAQTRPRFILSSEGVFGGMEFELMLTPREKSPLPKMSPGEDRTRGAVDSEPKHYQLSYTGPTSDLKFFFRSLHCFGYLVEGFRFESNRPGSILTFATDLLHCRGTAVTYSLILQWLPCLVPGNIPSPLGLVGLVSVHCDWVRWKV